MDEPLSSAGPTRATTTALRWDWVRREARLQSRLRSRRPPPGALARLIPSVVPMGRPLHRFPVEKTPHEACQAYGRAQ